MTDQELIVSALRQVGVIVAECLDFGADADEAITQLVAVSGEPGRFWVVTGSVP
jgi:hypothetical protein